MTTDNDKQTLLDRNVERQAAEFCASHGTCYDLDDARRALRDRPSLEAELAHLRKQVAAFNKGEIRELPENYWQVRCALDEATAERDRLREDNKSLRLENQRVYAACDNCGDSYKATIERLRGALREIAEWQQHHYPLSFGGNPIYKLASAALAKMEGGGEWKLRKLRLDDLR